MQKAYKEFESLSPAKQEVILSLAKKFEAGVKAKAPSNTQSLGKKGSVELVVKLMKFIADLPPAK